MAVYSFSKLQAFEQCPYKYKLMYIDKVTRPEEESIEVFLGDKVHKTLQKCYEDYNNSKLNTLDDLLSFFNRLWAKDWHSSIIINNKDYTAENYLDKGEKMLRYYYQRHAPFDADITLGTEVKLNFSLDDSNKYSISGRIDRMARARDNVLEIHDYKTSATLPGQKELDNDRQMGLYHLAIQSKWPPAQKIRLIWHYLAFDSAFISYRTPQMLKSLSQDTIKLIDKIESATEFPANKSALCNWCAYKAYCPLEKHAVKIEQLPLKEYLEEPGVKLVNKFAQLKQQADEINHEIELVRSAIIHYARKEGAMLLKGSDYQARVRIQQKLKFPGKNDTMRPELENLLKAEDKWMEVSTLDTNILQDKIETQEWDREVIQKVMHFSQTVESEGVSLQKLKEDED